MIGIEQVVEPDGRFFFKGDRFAICDGVPGIVALLFPVDRAIHSEHKIGRLNCWQ